jgi:hypothetical protein
MGAAVNIGIFVFIKIVKPGYDLPRLLCRSGVIQPDKIVTVHLFGEYGKIGAYTLKASAAKLMGLLYR